MSQYSQLSPGIIFEDLDMSTRAEIAVSTTGAAVFEAKRGTLKPFFAPDYPRFEGMYGPADPSITFAHDCMRAFYAQANLGWSKRVVNGALHAGSTYFRDNNSANAGGGRLLNTPFLLGSVLGYEGGARPFVLLAFDRALVAGNNFRMSITDGATIESIGPIAFTTDHNTTMQAIASAIATAMAAFGSSGLATLHNETGNKYLIRILPPTNVTLTFSAPEIDTVITFAGPFVASNSFAANVTGPTGGPVAVGPVAFTTDNATTLTAIATAFGTALGTIGAGGSATVVGSNAISLRRPTGKAITVTGVAVTGGASQTTGTVTLPVGALDTQARLFEVFAENPGLWGDDVGTKITNVDVGQKQRFRLTSSGPLVTGNTISCTVNGRVITQAFATDSDTTMAAFATALQADVDIETAEVEAVSGALDNDRSIVIVAATAAPTALAIPTCSVTGGASQPAFLIQETLKGVVPDGEFDFEVFDRSNLNIPIERHRVSLKKAVNGSGNQTAIDLRVNQDSEQTRNVRVVIADSARTYTLRPTLIGDAWAIDANVNFLGGGDDGARVLNSHIIDGWNTFKDRDKYPIRLLIACGYTNVSVMQKMIATAEYRRDAIAILDMPSDKQTAQAAYNFRLQDMNIDSSFGGIYTPDLLVKDNDSDELRYIPPSGHVAGQHAYSDREAAVWFAVAGLNRGKLPEVRGLRVNYELGDRELMYPVGINFIIDRPVVGPVIWSEETLQRKKSALSSLHTRRLLNALQIAYADSLDYVALFEPNNQFTRYNVTQVGERLLAPIKRAGGLYFYKVVCDESNNPPDLIDQDIIRVDIYVQVTRTAKRVLLRTVLQRTGASFAETQRAVNAQS
jgi:hypothetical protein